MNVLYFLIQPAMRKQVASHFHPTETTLFPCLPHQDGPYLQNVLQNKLNYEINNVGVKNKSYKLKHKPILFLLQSHYRLHMNRFWSPILTLNSTLYLMKFSHELSIFIVCLFGASSTLALHYQFLRNFPSCLS